MAIMFNVFCAKLSVDHELRRKKNWQIFFHFRIFTTQLWKHLSNNLCLNNCACISDIQIDI